jgi:hypothetical protein
LSSGLVELVHAIEDRARQLRHHLAELRDLLIERSSARRPAESAASTDAGSTEAAPTDAATTDASTRCPAITTEPAAAEPIAAADGAATAAAALAAATRARAIIDTDVGLSTASPEHERRRQEKVSHCNEM